MLQKCNSCFKSLSVPSRLQIYEYLLNTGTSNVSSIVSQLNVTQPTVSHHLSVMLHDGLLRKEKKGKMVYYSLNHNCPYDQATCLFYQITNEHAHHS